MKLIPHLWSLGLAACNVDVSMKACRTQRCRILIVLKHQNNKLEVGNAISILGFLRRLVTRHMKGFWIEGLTSTAWIPVSRISSKCLVEGVYAFVDTALNLSWKLVWLILFNRWSSYSVAQVQIDGALVWLIVDFGKCPSRIPSVLSAVLISTSTTWRTMWRADVEVWVSLSVEASLSTTEQSQSCQPCRLLMTR